MQKFILDAFISSVTECFETMMGCQVDVGDPYVVPSATCEQDINSMVGLSGRVPGNVIVGVQRGLAIQFTKEVIGHQTDSIDEQVIDAVGEIANMVVGGAKCRLTQFKLSISLPTVICGRGLKVNFPSGVRPVLVPFSVDGQQLSLCVGMHDAPDGTGEECQLPECESAPSKGPVLAFEQG
jgi:chemotaxis protein CheX